MYLCINRVTTNDYYHRHMSLIQLSESFRASHPLIKLKVGTVFSKISINVNSSKTIFLRLFYHHSSSLCSVLPPSVYQSPIQTLHTHTQWVWTKCSCRSRSLSLPPTSTLPPILLFYILSHFPLLLFFFKNNWHFTFVQNRQNRKRTFSHFTICEGVRYRSRDWLMHLRRL